MLMVAGNRLVGVLLDKVLEPPPAVSFMHITGCGEGGMMRAEQFKLRLFGAGT